MLWGKQGYAYYGQCENGEFSPFNEKIWCLFCFVVYQIIIRCEVGETIRMKSVLLEHNSRYVFFLP